MSHRFFLPPELLKTSEILFPQETARQIARVLRLKPGAHVIALDNAGRQAEVELSAVSNEAVEGRVLGISAAGGEPRARLTLYLGLTQREKFEWMLQKCTEVGVSEFLPVITSRTLIQKARDVEDKYPRWQKILREAAEQSHRGLIPALLPVTVFAQAVKQYNDALKLILWEDESKTGLKDLLHGYKGNSLTLVVGPEGGLSREEVDLASQNGFTPVTLGKRILRMETAAILAAGLALYDLG